MINPPLLTLLLFIERNDRRKKAPPPRHHLSSRSAYVIDENPTSSPPLTVLSLSVWGRVTHTAHDFPKGMCVLCVMCDEEWMVCVGKLHSLIDTHTHGPPHFPFF